MLRLLLGTAGFLVTADYLDIQDIAVSRGTAGIAV